jgi:release factor glutamine methyltransferase
MQLIRSVTSFFRVPLTKLYLQRERKYQYSEITVVVRPGVFHPGLFPSTRMLIRYLATIKLEGKRLLELGCGSGLIAIIAEKAGAVVTASDISTAAINNTEFNAAQNGSQISIIHSDLFDQIPTQVFDWIVINPPYYAKAPSTEAERAWFCGSDFQYFRKLFLQLTMYTAKETEVIMTLAQDADMDTIKRIAEEHGVSLQILTKRSSWFDGTDYLFRLTLP